MFFGANRSNKSPFQREHQRIMSFTANYPQRKFRSFQSVSNSTVFVALVQAEKSNLTFVCNSLQLCLSQHGVTGVTLMFAKYRKKPSMNLEQRDSKTFLVKTKSTYFYTNLMLVRVF